MSDQPKQKPEPYGYSGSGLEAYSSQGSPKVILDIVLQKIAIESVLDVGCGIGIWSHYAGQHVRDVMGIDGPWVPKENLKIPESNFKIIDITKPFGLGRKFDLVICLEVAEHVPEHESLVLLKNLTDHGDVVLFSAAIPGQGGFEHINEQWQSYWVKKFQSVDYEVVDVIRPLIWGKDEVKFYYQQNIMLCLKKDVLSKYSEFVTHQKVSWDIVHPELYNRSRDPKNISLKKVFKNLPSILRNYLRR